MGQLAELVDEDRIVDLMGGDKGSALAELVAAVAKLEGQPSEKALLQAILDREDLRSTGIGEGIAIPHCKDPRIKRFGVALGRAPQGIPFGSPDGQPAKLIAMICAPHDRQTEYLRLLSAVTRFLRKEGAALLATQDRKTAVKLLQGY